MITHRFAIAALLLAGLFTIPHIVRAAESYDNCSGFIDTLPATISTQGVWCLRHDLATNIAGGAAITIATNNVTIDCNDFKIGGLQGGSSSTANGIYAIGRQNATVRHCNVRGFYHGVYFATGAGNLVEDNRLDNNLFAGINVEGANNLIQRNRVYDTGGFPGATASFGIRANGSVIDNMVSGVFADATNSDVIGIRTFGDNTVVHGNQVGGLTPKGTGHAFGVDIFGVNVTVANNSVANHPATLGRGIYGNSGNTFCKDNTIAGFTTAVMADCQDAGGNASH